MGGGGITIAPNGTDVAVCYGADTVMDHYTFNRATGEFTFQETLFDASENYLPYIAAFSANSKKLYVGARFRTGLYQFDMEAADVSDSKVRITPTDTIADLRFCAPLLGPDDKIYVAGFLGPFNTGYYSSGNWLGVINKPEAKGLFVDMSNTAGSMSYSPVYIPAEQEFKMAIDSPVCANTLTKIEITDLNPANTYSFEWKINGADVNKDSASIHFPFPGSGNYTIYCKVCDTYSNFCSELDSVITVAQKPQLSINNQILCNGDKALVLIKKEIDVDYRWINSANPVLDSNFVEVGEHQMEAKNSCGAVWDTFEISKKQIRKIELYNMTICGAGDAVVDLLDYKSDGVKFYWPQFNDSSYYKVLNDVETTTYEIIATQCDSSKHYEMTVTRAPEKIWVPTAITPNQKGVVENETFKPYGVYYPEDYKMEIYSRWGEKIFETQDPNKVWDGNYQGKPVPQNSYLFVITARNCKNDRVGFKGTVYVIR